jgi:CHAT domain-containing protein
VESRSTAELMTNFYGGLAKGSAISTALRAAKLKLLVRPEYRHPFYWAGFVGIGAGF